MLKMRQSALWLSSLLTGLVYRNYNQYQYRYFTDTFHRYWNENNTDNRIFIATSKVNYQLWPPLPIAATFSKIHRALLAHSFSK